MTAPTAKQSRTLRAAISDASFAKKMGIPQKAAREIAKNDEGPYYAKGGFMKESKAMMSEDKAQDVRLIKKAFREHDKQEHKNGSGTMLKLKGGGMKDSMMGKMPMGGKAMPKKMAMGGKAMPKKMAMPEKMAMGGKAMPKKMAMGGGVSSDPRVAAMLAARKRMPGAMPEMGVKKPSPSGMMGMKKGGKAMPKKMAMGGMTPGMPDGMPNGMMNMPSGMNSNMPSGMKKGGKVMPKRYAKGGAIDGIASRGRTKGKIA